MIGTAAAEAGHLNEFDKDEWLDIARVLRPDITEDEFEDMWAEFCEMKRMRGMQ